MSMAPTTPRRTREPAPPTPGSRNRPVTEQLRGLIARVHFYAGLFVAPFIVIAALSGALYALAPTLEKIVYQDQISATQAAAPLPLAAQIAAAQGHVPGLDLVEIWPADEPGVATRVLFADESLPDGQHRAVFVDPSDASVTGDLSSYSGLGELPLRSWISGLHSGLHLGEAGEIYSELAASWLFILALSGLFLWWRKVRASRNRRRAAMLTGLDARPGSRQKTMSLHATLGTWLVVAMVGIAATGLTWSTYAGGNINSVVTALNWRSDPLQTSLNGDATEENPHAGHEGRPGGHAGHLDAAGQAPIALESARRAGLDGPLRMVAPDDDDTAWTVSQQWGPWVFSSDSVAIDGSDGRVIDRLDFHEQSLYSRLSSWGIYLHMGIMFGLPLQIALAATALGIVALAATGYRMWWTRRPTRGGLPAALGQSTGHAWFVYALAAAAALGVGLFLPVFGVSVAVFVVVDILVSLRSARARR